LITHVIKKKTKYAARYLLPPPLLSIEKLDQESKVKVLRDLVKTSPQTKVRVPLTPTMVIILLFVSTTAT